MRRGRRRRGGLGGLAGSVFVHGVAFAAMWLSARFAGPADGAVFDTYQIELVSPPPAPGPEQDPAELAGQPEELVVERPDPEPPPPAEALPDPEARRAEPPPPERRTPEPPADEPRDTASSETRGEPATDPDAAPTRDPGEGINVRFEGLRRDYPAYYGNIIRQIGRCFRWSRGGNWDAAVYFVINRDGTTSDARIVKGSGNRPFDFEALGAVECAGVAGRLGPLPEDLGYDRLPVRFTFRPSG